MDPQEETTEEKEAEETTEEPEHTDEPSEEPSSEEENGSFSKAEKEGQASFELENTDVTEEDLIEALKDCYDPEIPVNLYDLGLIHEVRVNGNKVDIDMTLTAPGCGFGPQIAKNVEMRMLEEDELDEANVEIVHDPPWTRDMVSEEGQAQLNMLGF